MRYYNLILNTNTDITTIMVIPYSHFELDTLQIEDFITAALPSLLDGLSMPIFLLLLGEIDLREAIGLLMGIRILRDGGNS